MLTDATDEEVMMMRDITADHLLPSHLNPRIPFTHTNIHELSLWSCFPPTWQLHLQLWQL